MTYPLQKDEHTYIVKSSSLHLNHGFEIRRDSSPKTYPVIRLLLQDVDCHWCTARGKTHILRSK